MKFLYLLVFWSCRGASAADPVPTPIADPTLENKNVLTDYAVWARKQHLKGPATELVCAPFAEGLNMCFTHLKGADRVYFTGADGKSPQELLKLSAGEEAASVAALEPNYVDGFSPRYFLMVGQVRADAALLFPDALERTVGGKCVVGVPAQGVLLAWIPGDLDFDKVMAVGVKRMYDTLPNPITSMLYSWNGFAWGQWGQAEEAAPKEAPR